MTRRGSDGVANYQFQLSPISDAAELKETFETFLAQSLVSLYFRSLGKLLDWMWGGEKESKNFRRLLFLGVAMEFQDY